ncbi:MAG: PRC-barrel domain-containing protein [Pseudolysinimonas sp.]|jgi:hypothetical protein
MLRSTQDLEHYAISATDGDIGHVTDFYFDDDAWVVRYLVVNTGSWLTGRTVLVSPISIREPDWINRTLAATITKEQVRHSPDIGAHKPVSRQYESLYLGYYGYANYWGGASMWGNGIYPSTLISGHLDDASARPELLPEQQPGASGDRRRRVNEDPHLRSCNEVVGYHLHASDGEIGHVEGFLLDEETWAIRFLIVNTSNWWLGHKVLIAPPWLKDVNWGTRTVSVDLSREAVKAAPPYVASDELSLEREVRLFEHYGRTWYGAGVQSLASQF